MYDIESFNALINAEADGKFCVIQRTSVLWLITRVACGGTFEHS